MVSTDVPGIVEAMRMASDPHPEPISSTYKEKRDQRPGWESCSEATHAMARFDISFLDEIL